MKFTALFASALAATVAFTVTPSLAQDYPTKEIQGIIQWGAGGSTDTVMRAVTPKAEEVLGQSIVLQNVTGGVGAIALNKVASGKADGYTLLMGAENPLLYKVMGLGTKDYSDFVPIDILARGTPILVARPDAPFDDYASMMAYIKEHPNEVKFGSTGPGGVPSVVTAMIENAEGKLPVTFIPYDGDGPALTALQGKAIDVMPAVLGAAIEGVKAGKMKPLAIIATEPVEQLPDVKPITDANEKFGKFLPWGPFFGIFAPKGTPENAVAKLQDAFKQAANEDKFKELMDNRGFILMNVAGNEAEDFMTKWQSNTTWLLQDAGLTKKSPEEFDIKKPE
ncbi:tripartite tricarboxylate transporter substrate binding protein [Jiella endophytica]|uniref:Tripartite tricarboxylate transporter substrate binding protein n=1 Tax=Jiella endophytica TaxID=2558362 RepID=A0A4Y8RP77_9HYPH|nr:tripartite tricarboxylate transporter substrate binding protein [Jiella endophytica]TFF24865.1 tripartite tricarboxylate transporter substrate binding protein [Jiella endophytica]